MASPPLGPIHLTFQSTLPVGGATDLYVLTDTRHSISIHAPRGGSDNLSESFLSFVQYFNPRSPWGERPYASNLPHPAVLISIHAPRGGSDLLYTCREKMVWVFQSTLPVGGATVNLFTFSILVYDFNPRSPWGERPGYSGQCNRIRNFNPRSPWGERPVSRSKSVMTSEFQSTLPVGGATAAGRMYTPGKVISIHAPRGGSDFRLAGRPARQGRFQSTLPVGGATRNSAEYSSTW